MTQAQIDTLNTITLVVWLGKWPFWLAWELWLIRERTETTKVKLLSQIAMRRAWQLNSVIYTEGFLLSHFVWTTLTPRPWWCGFAGWAVIVPLLVMDVLAWKTPREDYARWQRWARFPLLWACVGVANGHLLFPQVGPLPWNWNIVGW